MAGVTASTNAVTSRQKHRSEGLQGVARRMPSQSPPGAPMTAKPKPPPQPEHHEGSDDDQKARELGIDPDSYRYWKRACAALSPMTPEEIAAVGVVLRRIDDRLVKQRNQRPQQ